MGSENNDQIKKHNQAKFLELKALKLPLGQYAITSSGALGIRNLRAINDIDLIVTVELWNTLAEQYGIVDEAGVKKIVILGGLIEVMYENSFYLEQKEKGAPTVLDRIMHAEIIDDLGFESLETVLYYKRKMGREKDLKDIVLIENWMKTEQ